MIDCPVDKGMWADVMTKLLQGMAFRTMRLELMNCPANYEDPPDMGEHGGAKSETGIQKRGRQNRLNLALRP